MTTLDKVVVLVARTFVVFSPLIIAFTVGVLLKPVLGSLIFVILGIPCGPAILMLISHFQDKDQRSGYQSLL